MYGSKASELIRSITKEDGEPLPQYENALVEHILKENFELYAENLRTSQSIPEDNDDINEEEPQSGTSAEKDKNINRSQIVSEEELTQHSISDVSMSSMSAPNLENGLNKGTSKLGPRDNVDPAEKELMVMHARHTANLWNKRCLIAYHYERLRRLKKLRWEYGNNLPRHVVEKLSKNELEWFTKYNDNLFSYMSALNDGKGLDLTLYATPPKKLFIQVKCIKDYGQFDLDNGHVMLIEGSIHYLPLSQCEKLIQQGVLEQTNSL